MGFRSVDMDMSAAAEVGVVVVAAAAAAAAAAAEMLDVVVVVVVVAIATVVDPVPVGLRDPRPDQIALISFVAFYQKTTQRDSKSFALSE
jgi:hypothetical protein